MPKATQTIERLDADPRYASEALTLRVLVDGHAAIERELDSLRLEEYLRERPHGPNVADLRERLNRNRGSAKRHIDTAKPNSDAPPAVAAALTLLKAGPQATRRLDHKAVIARLEDDIRVLREGIMAQQGIVDALRDTASAALAARLRERHRQLVLQQFRTLQAAAAAGDELRHFRSDVLGAGYIFRADLLPEPVVRSALILGSEVAWDSEISRTRRLLEELKIL